MSVPPRSAPSGEPSVAADQAPPEPPLDDAELQREADELEALHSQLASRLDELGTRQG